MSHRYLQNGLTTLQYLSYLLVGALYFWIFGAMARGVGNSLVGLGAVFIPLVLGGYASALSLFMPRGAAVVAMTCSVPYLILGIPGLFRIVPASPYVVTTSVVIMVVSLIAFFWSEDSVWRRSGTMLGKMVIVVLAALPALFATWRFGTLLAGFLSYLHRAT